MIHAAVPHLLPGYFVIAFIFAPMPARPGGRLPDYSITNSGARAKPYAAPAVLLAPLSLK